MSEDIVERLRTWGPSNQPPPARDMLDAADEIERLRARITELELKTFDLGVMARYEKEMSLTANTNLSEALRLMEPVAEAEEATHWPYVVTVVRDDARAIADFVKRMRGGSNE